MTERRTTTVSHREVRAPSRGESGALLPQWLRRVRPDVLLLASALVGVAAFFPYVKGVQTVDVMREGEVAKETLIAPFTFDIPKSADELQRERDLARAQVPLVADYDPEVRRRAIAQLRDLRRSLALMSDRALPDSSRARLRDRAGKVLSQNTLNALAARPAVADLALPVVDRTLSRGIMAVLLVESTQKLAEMRARYNSAFGSFRLYDRPIVMVRRDSVEKAVACTELVVKEAALEGMARELRAEHRMDATTLNALYELIAAFLGPNVTINDTVTDLRRIAAAAEVLPIKGKVIRDTEIVRKHQEVTTDVVEKLRALQAAMASASSIGERRRVLAGNVGRLSLALLPLLFLAFYLRRFRRAMADNVRHAGALVVVILLQVALVRAGLLVLPRLFESGTEFALLVPQYLIPVAVGSMLATILFGLEIGFAVTLYVAIFSGIVQGFDLAMFLFALLGGMVAGFATRGIRYRWDFFRSIPPMLGMYALLVGLWQLAGGRGFFLVAMLQNMGLATAGAVLSTFLAMMAATVFENVFDVTTNMTLVELSDMNNPVLKRLSIEAAGTYNHSVLVANLAESAALRIGANALLARVASYYHDIGKLAKADYFIENATIADRNRHSRLSPSMSALVISSHVRDGVELARKHRLPRAIRDAILQHHGNSTVSFFYEKALEQDTHKQVQEEDFRYPGPRPQTRENAVIMLADSVEAASRSLATSSPRLLRELVRKIIRDKFFAAQLDQCDLTLRDLDEIVEGFMPVLQGIFHVRIEYPSM
jgi:putative nucleotidyltransferase with HDIG domain